MTSNIDFKYLLSTLESQSSTREQIREFGIKPLEQTLLLPLSTLSKIHTITKLQSIDLLESIDLGPVVLALQHLGSLLPEREFYRWNDLFSNSVRNCCFIVVLREFLLNGELIDLSGVGKVLGYVDGNINFFLSLEDYLHSIISLLNELSRLAINRVILTDYSSALQFSIFSKEIATAFGVLNLKNDTLRKRFDGIKYDVKKLEEVVYDLSLRGLLKNTTATTNSQDGETAVKRARIE